MMTDAEGRTAAQPASETNPPGISATSARQGVISGRVVTVLTISVIGALVALYLAYRFVV